MISQNLLNVVSYRPIVWVSVIFSILKMHTYVSVTNNQQSFSEGTTQMAEMILIAPGGRISYVSHINFVYVWNTR